MPKKLLLLQRMMSRISFFIILSLIIHLLILFFLFSRFKNKENIKQITIDEVEFLEKSKNINPEIVKSIKKIEEVSQSFYEEKSAEKKENVEINKEGIEAPKEIKIPGIEEIGDKKIEAKVLVQSKKIKNFDIKNEVFLKGKEGDIKNNSIEIDFDKKVDLSKRDFDTKITRSIPNIEEKVIIVDRKKKEIEKIETNIQPEFKEKKKEIIEPIKLNVESNRSVVKKDISIKSSINNFNISGALQNRQIVFSKMPEYPSWAQEKGIEAFVKIYFEVSKDGEVIVNSIKIEITSGYKKLDDVAINSLKSWKFASINNDGTQSGIVRFDFKLS